MNGNDNSLGAESGDRVSDGERFGELDNADQADKKNRNGNSRNNKARRRGETQRNDDKGDKIAEDISSVEAAE
jgi:hypothetical protein